jgi:4-hydroxy-tetrahydrodipicolinate reductase
MGKEIEKVLLERGHTISHIISSKDNLDLIDFSSTQAVIEFSTPTAAKNNIEFCLKHKLPIVIGTTGWYDDLDELSSLCQSHKTAMIHATNFSLGVNLFFNLNQHLAKLMNNHPSYNCTVTEIHHTEKKDAPSGTGITIAEGIITELDQLTDWENVSQADLSSSKNLSLASERLPNVPGTHDVKYENEIDKIEISHTAHSRKGFALGSVIATEWIANKKGVFTMSDVLGL